MRPSLDAWKLILILLGITFGTERASGQPHLVTYWTLEARIAQAETVVVGTIARITRNQIVPWRGYSFDGRFQPDGVVEHALTVKVDEVLKGNVKGTLDNLRPVEGLYFGEYYGDWLRSQTALLWFVGPAPPGERSGWTVIRLGGPGKAEAAFAHAHGPPVFSMDFTLLTDDRELLTRARTFARTSTRKLPVHVIRIPPLVAGSGGPWNDLIVPVEPSLEQRAKRLIASPQDFVPVGKTMDALARYQLRVGGVTSLRYFKSDANITLLRSLLDEPPEVFKNDHLRQYPLRTKALEILLQWGAAVPVLRWAGEVTVLDLAGTEVTDVGLRQLVPLTNLTRLDLQNTRVTEKGLRALAPLKKLTLLSLGEEQMTDANLRVLREIGFLHALGQASKGNDRRPQSEDEVIALGLDRAPVTDAVLKEFAVLKNLASLSLRESRVTGTGFKELAGLKHLTQLFLDGTPVTAAGLKELAGLEALTDLRLRGTKVTDAGLAVLARLKNLKSLELTDTEVSATGLKELSGLQHLTSLHLSDVQVTDATLQVMRAMGKLHVLDQAGARGDRRPTSAAEVASFSLGGTLVTDAGLKELAGLNNLHFLYLGRSKVTGTGLRALTGLQNLTDLSVDGAPLTADGLRELAGLKSLATLHMHGRDVTDARLRVLRETGMLHVLYGAGATARYPPATLPPRAPSDAAVRSLDLGGWYSTDGTVVSDAGLKELAGLKNLVHLNLAFTRVAGTGAKDLAGLPRLNRLDLGGPQVTDAGLKEVARLKGLASLTLAETTITPAGLRALTGSKNLVRLVLAGKDVNDAWLKELAGLDQLRSLRLVFTTVTDAAVTAFRQARPACKIDR